MDAFYRKRARHAAGQRNVEALDAAAGRAVLRHGHRERVRLEEVDLTHRAPIIKRYLELVPGARAHLPVDFRAPLTEFARIAEQYPMFRICAGQPE